MNPTTVNSANIAKFGFKATFDLLNRVLKFDISALTEFVGANAALTNGVGFEIIDPNGVTVHQIDFDSPDIPNDETLFQFDLSDSDNIFGIWKIKGAIKDQDGTIHYAEIPPKEICKPVGLEDGSVKGVFKIKVDCDAPYIQVSENTNLTYLGKAPASVSKSGVLYYPQGTVSQLAFNATPFQDNRLYTGTYTVRNATTALYDMGDNIFVEIRYDTALEEEVTCNGRMCDIMCCIYDLQVDAEKHCTTAVGRKAKEKLALIGLPLVIGTAKERCGKSSTKEVDEIRKILGCECNCEGQKVEATPVQLGGGNAVSVVGTGGTQVVHTTVGSTQVFTINNKTYNVVKGDLTDESYTIVKKIVGNEIIFELTFNHDVLANTILTTIQNSTELKNFINSLVTSVNINNTLLSGLDGKCIINMSACDYFLIGAVSALHVVNSINVDGVVHEAPDGLLAIDESAVVAWLNSLGLGTFSYSVGQHTIAYPIISSSNGNTRKVNSIRINNTDRAYTANCKGVKQVTQAVIDFICSIDASKVKLGGDITLCDIAPNGTKRQTTYQETTSTLALIQAFSTAFCTLVDSILKISKVTCEDVQGIFNENVNTELAVSDYILGSKGNVCSRVTLKELALYFFELAKTDPEVHQSFCAIDCGSIPQSCITITDFTGTAALE